MKTAAIYTRVSSDQQKENKTIGSQVDELLNFAEQQGYVVPDEYVFKDEGYSGAILVRPGLEKVRDLSAEGQIQAILIYSPDRLSRNYAYQVVLMDEFASCGTEVLFINSQSNLLKLLFAALIVVTGSIPPCANKSSKGLTIFTKTFLLTCKYVSVGLILKCPGSMARAAAFCRLSLRF